MRGQDQPAPPRHMRAALAGIAAVGEGGGLVEHGMEEALIGFELERVRLDAAGIRDHAVGGHDGETFDAIGAGHVRGPSLYARPQMQRGGLAAAPWHFNIDRLTRRRAPRSRPDAG